MYDRVTRDGPGLLDAPTVEPRNHRCRSSRGDESPHRLSGLPGAVLDVAGGVAQGIERRYRESVSEDAWRKAPDLLLRHLG